MVPHQSRLPGEGTVTWRPKGRLQLASKGRQITQAKAQRQEAREESPANPKECGDNWSRRGGAADSCHWGFTKLGSSLKLPWTRAWRQELDSEETLVGLAVGPAPVPTHPPLPFRESHCSQDHPPDGAPQLQTSPPPPWQPTLLGLTVGRGHV